MIHPGQSQLCSCPGCACKALCAAEHLLFYGCPGGCLGLSGAVGALSFGSLQISLKGLEFVPPVTFMLQCGTGPVYLSGQHITCESQLGYGAGWQQGWSCSGFAAAFALGMGSPALQGAPTPGCWA